MYQIHSVAATAVLLLAGALLSGEPPSSKPNSTGDPPPSASTPRPAGKLVDLGGRRLHAIVSGTGSPSVVVENGSGAFSIDWALVQPEVAKFTQICTYDRAGSAWSDPGPVVDGVEQTVDDLHLLLQKAGIRPPYVLVGASLGGMFVRAYQRRNPDQVAGLVLVDAVHDEGFAFAGKLLPSLSAEDVERLFESFRQKPPPPPELPTAVEDPMDRLPKGLQASRLWADRKYQANRDFSRGMVTVDSWRQEMIALRRERLSEAHPLGKLPLTVLARTKATDSRRRKLQTELAGLSSISRLVWAENSGHEIHLYRPGVVVEAIREMVASIRGKATSREP
jgi:pimeloyl-ACP methyl ester carboxylesterase